MNPSINQEMTLYTQRTLVTDATTRTMDRTNKDIERVLLFYFISDHPSHAAIVETKMLEIPNRKLILATLGLTCSCSIPQLVYGSAIKLKNKRDNANKINTVDRVDFIFMNNDLYKY